MLKGRGLPKGGRNFVARQAVGTQATGGMIRMGGGIVGIPMTASAIQGQALIFIPAGGTVARIASDAGMGTQQGKSGGVMIKGFGPDLPGAFRVAALTIFPQLSLVRIIVAGRAG